MMTIDQLRICAQHISFVIFSFGKWAGISLGSSLPCFSCPYVAGCGGRCYLHRLQSDLTLPLATLFSYPGWEAFLSLLLFLGLFALFGKSWCGWICPFGLLQDWITWIRRRLGIREARWSPQILKAMNMGKYVMLGLILLSPLLVLIHVDFFRPFCAICPAKVIMPTISGGSAKGHFWFLDFTNNVTLILSFFLLAFTGVVLAGMFFKERFFCFFCPMAAIMHLTRPLALLRLQKSPPACHGCATCSRVCPMDLDTPHTTMEHKSVQGDGCNGCFHCAQTCCSNGSLRITFGSLTLFKSSRNHAAGIRLGKL